MNALKHNLPVHDSWKIETTAASWYDDYNDWLKPYGPLSCCMYNDRRDEFCPSSERPIINTCDPCLEAEKNYTSDEYYFYLEFFLKDNPSLSCGKGSVVWCTLWVELLEALFV